MSRMETRKKELTSRVIIDDTCSIKAGIVNIVPEVLPFCFNWPFNWHARIIIKAKHNEKGRAGSSK